MRPLKNTSVRKYSGSQNLIFGTFAARLTYLNQSFFVYLCVLLEWINYYHSKIFRFIVSSQENGEVFILLGSSTMMSYSGTSDSVHLSMRLKSAISAWAPRGSGTTPTVADISVLFQAPV